MRKYRQRYGGPALEVCEGDWSSLTGHEVISSCSTLLVAV